MVVALAQIKYQAGHGRGDTRQQYNKVVPWLGLKSLRCFLPPDRNRAFFTELVDAAILYVLNIGSGIVV